MKKQPREVYFVIGMFTVLSIWGNHAHLWFAATHGVWWYLSFYLSTYILSVITIFALAFVLSKSAKNKTEPVRGVDVVRD